MVHYDGSSGVLPDCLRVRHCYWCNTLLQSKDVSLKLVSCTVAIGFGVKLGITQTADRPLKCSRYWYTSVDSHGHRWDSEAIQGGHCPPEGQQMVFTKVDGWYRSGDQPLPVSHSLKIGNPRGSLNSSTGDHSEKVKESQSMNSCRLLWCWTWWLVSHRGHHLNYFLVQWVFLYGSCRVICWVAGEHWVDFP